MEASSQSRDGGGLWNNPRPTQYSKETQDMLKLMMEELKLTYVQRKQINECLKNGTALPRGSDPPASASTPQPKTSKRVQKHRLPCKPQRRTAEACRSGNSYVREKFCPGPTRDLEKEKRRLQNILATGQEEPAVESLKNVSACQEPEVVERDRYQEVVDEINERRQFLADMASLGKESYYISIVNTEISQKRRELKMMDKTRNPKEDALKSERKEQTAEQTTEHMNMIETGGEKNP